ncbi:MAG: protein-disulfide reductase DsbD [Gammaproteobacteria bacterium]|jgi:thiol:disulfide interchange protein DsbD|tara:strand:- start:1708 stop:3549 length:1842 start_codon:yes stop_codon:yes gene_type:complete
MKQFFSIILLLVLVPLSTSWAETLSVDKESNLSESNQPSTLLESGDNLGFEKRPVKVNEAFKLSAVSIDENTIAVRWIVKDNYYLYKDKISFSVKGATIQNALFPLAKLKVDEFFGEVSIYNSSVEVILSLTDIISNTVELTVDHQGCWEGGVCYPPQSDTIQVGFEGAQAFSSENDIQITSAEKSANEKFQQGGLTLLIAAFLAGLALSWTPCVYPMVPILSGIIIGQKKAPSTPKAILMSVVFVFSMSLAYALIGASAGYFGAGINIQAIMQTPWILVVFSLIFLFLAFSMFGYYDIQLPSKLQIKITNLSNRQTGGDFIGVSIMGFLSALIVGPCVTPFLATALSYVIAGGSAAKGAASLFAMGLGMGIPLIIICGWGVNTLPKAGPWMENVKKIFGLSMIAVSLYLLDRILNPLLSLILWSLLFTIAPIMLGVFNKITKPISFWNLLFKAICLILLAYAILLWLLVAKGGGDIQQPLDSIIYGDSIDSSNSVDFQVIKNEDEFNKLLATTKINNRLLVIKFYAEWCISCNKLERVVFSNKQVNQVLSNSLKFTLDVTENNRFNQSVLARFSLVGPPAILFFKNGQELRDQRIIGEFSTKEFVNHINNLQ